MNSRQELYSSVLFKDENEANVYITSIIYLENKDYDKVNNQIN